MDKAYQGFLKSNLIWNGNAFGMIQFKLPNSSIDFSDLPAVPRNRRLGHQAEFVFLQLLNACSEYEVIAHSIQLIDGKRTLGELDYIIQNVETKEILHIELTYKFYILDKSISDPINQIVGPNRTDAFAYKLNKTRDKQMPLLYSKPGKEVIKELGLDINQINQLVAFYAHIFVPYSDRSFDIKNLNKDCLAGYWVTKTQMQLETFKSYFYYRPTKSEWLHIPHYEVEWKSFNEIMVVVSASLDENRSVMLWKMDEATSKLPNSIERIFVCRA